MRVLITGGAGYIGTRLTKRLVTILEIEKVMVYDNLSRGNFNFFLGDKYAHPEKIKVIQGDVLDSRQVKKVLREVDVVVHMAAKVTTPFANADPHFYEQVNHWGTAEMVYAIEESTIDKLIYLSSTSVYGANADMATEKTTPAPQTFYGISKLRGEEHVERLFSKKNALILRCGNVYGYSRSMRFDAVINRFMFDANFSNRIQIFGTGKQSRAFIHVDYLTDSLAQAILATVPSSTYNLVDKNLHIYEIVDALKEMYPTMEFLFSNQHMNLRELTVNPESAIYTHIDRYDSRDLKTELREFKEKFAY